MDINLSNLYKFDNVLEGIEIKKFDKVERLSRHSGNGSRHKRAETASTLFKIE